MFIVSIVLTMHELLLHYWLSVKNTNIRTESNNIIFLLVNFLLSLSLFHPGGSATNVFKMFSHIGLSCVSPISKVKFKLHQDFWY